MDVSERDKIIFVARQPIFDRNLEVFGYELLFRSGATARAGKIIDPVRASLDVLANSFLVFGLERLTGGKKAFVNFSEELLLKDIPLLVPPSVLVIELLETINISEELLKKCKFLRQKGYLLALDDFAEGRRLEPLIPLVDFIKVDFLATSPEKIKAIPQKYARFEVKFLAEKVEDENQFQLALKSGYHYFQGYFFSRPSIFSSKPVSGLKQNILRVFKCVTSPDCTLERLENVLKCDLELVYALLNYINSAFFALPNKVSSVRQALVLLGKEGVIKWVSLILVSSLAKNRPAELIILSLFRARFLELMAQNAGLRGVESYFLLGLLSLLDVLLGRPFSELTKELPISQELKEALEGKPNIFRQALDLCMAYERGRWEALFELKRPFPVSLERLNQIYLEALNWADKLFKTLV